MKLDPNRKHTALLAPVFALRRASDEGIGDTQAMREAVDFCVKMGFSVLQTLPIHEVVGDYSPYNPISSCALSPALLTLSPEEVPGFPDRETMEKAAPASWLSQLRQGAVKYNSVQSLKIHLLLASHRRFLAQAQAGGLHDEFAKFKKENAEWLDAYTLFRLLIREYEGNTNWTEWQPVHQNRASAEAWFAHVPQHNALEQVRDGFAFIQWVAARQWASVRSYAEARDVLLMGEMSFGVSRASVDTWERPELFDLDWSMGAQSLGAFDASKDSERWGQNWGFPPYRWENHRSEGFAWLRRRIRRESLTFHLCRVDHLRGYFRAYMMPWGGGPQHTDFSRLDLEQIKQRTGGRIPRFVPGPDSDPMMAKLNDLQGREVISVLKEAAGSMALVAELMADMTPYMRQALEDLAVPSLSLPTLDRNPDHTLLPIASFRPLSLATYATHDHAPLAVQYANLVLGAQAAHHASAVELESFLHLVGWKGTRPDEMNDALLEASQRTLLGSPCVLAAFLTSDMLGIRQRYNLPGSYGAGTWAERLECSLEECLRHATYGPRLKKLKEVIAKSGRIRPSLPVAVPAPAPQAEPGAEAAQANIEPAHAK
ncbi:4-alpha-glucanotransferase [Verrucomicrobium sp. GAS474]|uniref:4-alpha-glucanotransferase n=1 Tax=Verrucomicrobium sp. GAS474 TaxID=1882831 RepID=UPI00087DF315|nr:4-alpha-glucanotransferase [Verrucomicrobium sp. GAS474]SDU05367.1 4-alpha-glucanotransferase [Verrucomicrobium sp. GAS474]